MTWKELGQWWVAELADDDACDRVITPILIRMLEPRKEHRYLDLGAGEGRVMRTVRDLGAEVVGLGINEELARVAGALLVADLPRFPQPTTRSTAYTPSWCSNMSKTTVACSNRRPR